MTTQDSDAAIKYAATPDDLVEFRLEDAYKDWLEAEGVKVIVDFAFEDLSKIELGPWERKGGKGAVINIPYDTLTNDTHIVEISPGGRSEPEHHVYEEYVYIVSGRGATSIWVPGSEKKTFEWQKGSLFSIPLNCWYEHFNGSGTEPARYLSVTNAPPMMRLFNDNDFIFNSDYHFKGRYGGEDDFFSGNGKLYKRRIWASNFMPNAPDMALYEWSERGAGGINSMFEMAGNLTKAHISEFPVGTYKKAHRHGPGANLVLLSGDAGFSLLWNKEDMSDIRKADWKVGSLVIVPADATYHQHFNSGNRRARYLALTPQTHGLKGPVPRSQGADQSFKAGGYQVEYDEESPRIHEIFEEELRKNGVTCRMKAFVPTCTGEVGPTKASQT